MAQYINKDALVAEIENLENTYKKCPTRNSYEDGLKEGRLIGYKDALHKINTLEVKEVDLENNTTDTNFEEEIDNFMYGTRNPERFPDSFQVRDEHTGLTVLDWKCYANNPKRRIEFAKHFFELGLIAQKGE